MSQPRIIITAGYVAVREPALGTMTLDSWPDALEYLRTTLPGTVAVGIEQPTGRSVMMLGPDGPTAAEEGTVPDVLCTAVPWTVSVGELSAQPALADDVHTAFRLACESLPHLPDGPHEIPGLLITSTGEHISVLVTTGPEGTVRPAAVERAVPADVHEDDEGEVDPFSSGLNLSDESSLPEDFDASIPWDDDVDDSEVIYARAQKMTGKNHPKLLMVLAGAVVLVMLMIGVLIGRTASEPAPEPDATQAGLQRTPISGWGSDASWTRSVHRDARIAATPDGRFVATVSREEKLIISDAETGKEAAALPLTGVPNIGPRGSTVSGRQSIIARTGDQLTVWSEDGPGQVIDLGELDTPTVISFAGEEPLVMAEDNSRVWRVTDDGLKASVHTERGFRPYAMNRDGSVIVGAAEPARVLTLSTSGEEISHAELTAPAGDHTPGRWLAVRPQVTVLLWQEGEDDSTGILAVHSTATGEILSQVDVDNADVLRTSTAVSSDRSSLLAVPGAVIDMEAPERGPVLTPGFAPTAVVASVAFGRDRAGARSVVSAEDGEIERLNADAVVPWTTTAQGYGIVEEHGIAYAVAPQSRD